jgi:hypothetical protein
LAWIELHDTLGSHRKTYALAETLDIPQYAAVGLLCLLWTWALDNAQDGDLSEFPPHAIARACFWQKKPETLADSLIKCGWMDDNMHLHNWENYAGRLIDKRQEEKRRVAAYRTGKKPARNAYSTRTEHVQYASTVPNSTVPNSTVPNNGVINAREDHSSFISLEDAQALQAEIDTVRREALHCGLPVTDLAMDEALALKTAHGLDKLLEAMRKTGKQTKDKWTWAYVGGVLTGKGKPTQDTSNPFAAMLGKG